WKDQVFVDVTGRNDWSSSLVYSDKHGNYSYYYPSVSGSWLIHETFRDKLPEWISFMKIRGSWAQVGNDTDAYSINSAYSLLTATLDNGGNIYALSVPSQAFSNNLKPERKNAWEIGLDWRFLENRIGLDATYYKENTKNQIMSISVPSISGISSQKINAGNIQNQGIEIALNTTPIKTADFEWNLDFTWTKNMSKIVELHPNVANYIVLDGEVAYGNYRVGSVAKVGESYGLLMTDSNPKVDKATGLPVLDATSYYGGDRGMHAMYYQRSGVAETVGSLTPDFLGSVNTSLNYKNWSLRASFDMRFGGKVASYASRYGTAYGMTETSLRWRDTENGGMTYTSIWDGKTYHDGVIPVGLVEGGVNLPLPNGGTYKVPEGGETYQSLYDKGLVDPQHASTWHYWNNAWGTGTVNEDWLKTLNYVAIREITVSYKVPQKFCHKFGAQNMNLSLSGRNLGYLVNTMPNGENPESVRGTSASEFRVRSFNGLTANYTFTINVGF
ncbi:MAG: TonB-dependent receptor, partial [Phocaeicola sp.]|nr:TonB-dependent receptor [Phocaeicola sp.]